MDGCNFRDRCCFLKRMEVAESALWQSQMSSYCHGSLYCRCERRRFFLETGDCAPLHLTPSGEIPEIRLP